MVSDKAGVGMAAEHLLGIYSPVGILLESGKKEVVPEWTGICLRFGHNRGDLCFSASGQGRFWGAHFSGFGGTSHDFAGSASSQMPSGCWLHAFLVFVSYK